MKLHYLFFVLVIAGCGTLRLRHARTAPTQPVSPGAGGEFTPTPLGAGPGTLILTNSGTGAASLTGDPNSGYALNIPYFAGFLTTQNSGGLATLTNGVLNVPQYQAPLSLNTSGTGSASLAGGALNIPNNQPILTTSGTTGAATFNPATNILNIPTYSSGTSGGVPSGSVPGQLLIVGGTSGSTVLAASNPGIAEATASPVSTTPLTPSCGTAGTNIGDLSQTFVLQAGAVVNAPTTACTNAVFYFFSQAGSTFNAGTGQIFQIYNGVIYNTGTTYAASAGQYITMVRSKAANTWILAIGNASAAAPAQFISSITNVGSSGPATVSAGVLNVPDYSTAPEPPPGIQIPAGALAGQVLAIDATNNVIAGSPGLSDSVVSPLGTAYTLNCGGSSDLGDRSHITVITSAIMLTVPATSANGNCKNAVFYFLMRAAATFMASGTDTFDVYNGATAATAQTSYLSNAGQYISLINGNGSIWHLLVGSSATGPLNEQEHYFAPDFTVNVGTTPTSVGQGINPITALTTPQMRCSFYFIVDSPTANTKIQAHLYRTTGTIPAAGAAPNAGDVQVMIVTFSYAASGALTALGGAIIDTTGAVTGTAYRYYLALDSAVPQNVNIHAQSYIQIAESH